MKTIKIKRIYDKPQKSDGARIYVDRYWARGLSKDNARIDEWIRDIAPSDELRKWYQHDPDKWKEFRRKYFIELKGKPEFCFMLLDHKDRVITLLFSSKELKFNNAAALKEYIEKNYNS